MRLLLYTGQGGVGKTTTAAATGAVAARRGHRPLLISADAAHSLGDVLDEALSGEPRCVAPALDPQFRGRAALATGGASSMRLSGCMKKPTMSSGSCSITNEPRRDW